MNSDFQNIVEWLFYQSQQQPDKAAYVEHLGESSITLSFGELKPEIVHISNLLQQHGINKGDKVLLLSLPNVELAIILYSLLGIGAVPVVIDPAIGFSAVSQSIIRVQPGAVVALPIFRHALPLFSKTFASVTTVITTDDLKTESAIIRAQPAIFYQKPQPEDLAAIFFTSGSTDLPKPVEWTHRQLLAHVASVPKMIPIDENTIDLALFPLSMLISPVLGITCHVPDFKKVKPKKTDCEYLYRLITTVKPTICFASPAIWCQLANYCQQHKLTLESLRFAVSGGAPIVGELAKSVQQVLTQGELYTPYGATEASPIACAKTIEFSEEKGVKLGRPVQGIKFVIEPRKSIHLPDNSYQVGEIKVAGDLVSKHYHLAPELDAQTKQRITEEGQDICWHLTGDVGMVDENDELWYLGRLKDVVIDQRRCYFTSIAEEKINQLPQVSRCALLAIKPGIKQQIILVVETKEKLSAVDKQMLNVEIKKQLSADDYWVDKVEYIKRMPLDKRHYFKIDRAGLKVWVEKRIKE